MGKNDDLLAALVIGAAIVGIAGFFAKPKCPACKSALVNKPNVCPYCRTPLVWRK